MGRFTGSQGQGTSLCCLAVAVDTVTFLHLIEHGLTCPSVQGFGVYRYANKYGANVDGYSPIYTPDTWSESGSNYTLGTKGLIAW